MQVSPKTACPRDERWGFPDWNRRPHGAPIPPSKTQAAVPTNRSLYADEGASPECIEPRGMNSQPFLRDPVTRWISPVCAPSAPETNRFALHCSGIPAVSVCVAAEVAHRSPLAVPPADVIRLVPEIPRESSGTGWY